MKRRTFIDFIGKGALILPALPSVLTSCNVRNSGKIDSSIFPSSKDDLVLAEGLEYEILIKEDDQITDLFTFGSDNDYIAFVPTDDPDEGILWVNHEDMKPLFVSGYTGDVRSIKQIRREMGAVGGTILKIKKENGKWKPVFNDPANYRVTGASKIPFEWPEMVDGYRSVVGTLGNCSGGITPWGTILTCEENYHSFYGEHDYATGEHIPSHYKWETFMPDHKPQHYGWVVEVNVETGSARKHVGLGRMAHECATVKELPDKRVVVYTGDDINNGCIFKYISDEPGKIYPGKLYVANMEAKTWEWLDISRPELKDKFEDQTQVLIRARESSLLVGGSKMDRPEDIDIDPITGDVLITLTNNKPAGNYHGSILSIKEGGDYDALTFEYDTFLTGGEETGFSCPDNMAFDKAGNLWFCSDISGSAMGKTPYEKFGNNGLFVLVRHGEEAGEVFQVASAPNDAEFTGPFFAPDGETLFLSVQHPGSTSKDLANLTSHWPGGGTTMPRSAVVAIQGEIIKSLQTIV